MEVRKPPRRPLARPRPSLLVARVQFPRSSRRKAKMSKLTQEERDKLKKKEFVFPKERRYPIHDEGHGRAALSMVAKHGTPEEKAQVHAKVCSKYNFPSCKTPYENPLS